MRSGRRLFAGLLILVSAAAAAQDFTTGHHRLTAFWGSLRTPYSAVSSGLSYEADRLAEGVPFGMDARIESFGTFWILGSPSFDASVTVTYRGPGPGGSVWLLGVGGLWEGRYYTDERSAARPGLAPVVRSGLGSSGNLGTSSFWWGAEVVIDVAFYRDGAAIGVVPSFRGGWGAAFLSLQEKNRWLAGGPGLGTEFRWDTALGLGVAF